MAGRQFNENNANVPSQDSTDNVQERDVVGNKTDTAATPSSTTSVVAIIKKIHDELITLADGTEIFAKSGPDSVEIDDDATYGLGLYDVGDDPPTTAEITPGNYQIDRIRDGALTNIVASTPASEATGRIYASEVFAAADWAIGDLALITFSGGSVTTGTTTTTLPNAYFYTRVSREESIEGKLGTFPTTYNNISRSTLTDIFTGMFSLFGANGTNVFNPTIDGSARTTMEAALNALASYSASGGAAIAATVNPGGSSRASLELILEDFADMWAGSAGIITYPAGVAAGDGVSFAEALRYASEEVDKVPKSDAAVTWNSTALQSIQDEAEDALEGENLDHLQAVTTVTADMTAEVVDGSVVSRILSKTSDTSTYDPTTDAQEMLSDKLGGFSGDGGAAQDDSTKASLDLAHTDLDAIIGYVDGLACGEAEGTASASNLYAGTATSGITGADVVTISTTTRKKLHVLLVNMVNCATGATASVRMYTKVLNGGSMEKFYDQDFVKGTDPDVIPIVTGTLGIRNDVRVEMQSDNSGDTSRDVVYSYITEDSE